MTPNSLKTTQKGKEKEGNRVERKRKRAPHTPYFYITLIPLEKGSERKIKIIAAHRLRRLNRGALFSKILVDIITAFSDRQARDIGIKSTLYPEYNKVSSELYPWCHAQGEKVQLPLP